MESLLLLLVIASALQNFFQTLAIINKHLHPCLRHYLKIMNAQEMSVNALELVNLISVLGRENSVQLVALLMVKLISEFNQMAFLIIVTSKIIQT